jgi:hypothetical protein
MATPLKLADLSLSIIKSDLLSLAAGSSLIEESSRENEAFRISGLIVRRSM